MGVLSIDKAAIVAREVIGRGLELCGTALCYKRLDTPDIICQAILVTSLSLPKRVECVYTLYSLNGGAIIGCEARRCMNLVVSCTE